MTDCLHRGSPFCSPSRTGRETRTLFARRRLIGWPVQSNMCLNSDMRTASDAGTRVHAGKEDWRLGRTIRNRTIAMTFSMDADIERDLLPARTGKVHWARMAAGLPLGWPKGPGKSDLDRFRPEIEALISNGFTAKPCSTTSSNFTKETAESDPAQSQ